MTIDKRTSKKLSALKKIGCLMMRKESRSLRRLPGVRQEADAG